MKESCHLLSIGFTCASLEYSELCGSKSGKNCNSTVNNDEEKECYECWKSFLFGCGRRFTFHLYDKIFKFENNYFRK